MAWNNLGFAICDRKDALNRLNQTVLPSRKDPL